MTSALRLRSFPAFAGRMPRYEVHLNGPEGDVQFVFSRWDGRLRDMALKFPDIHTWLDDGTCLNADDLGWHRVIPAGYQSEWEYITEKCEDLDGRRCSYDGSGVQAQQLLKDWIDSGNDGLVLDVLRDRYRYWLDAEPPEFDAPRWPLLRGALTAKAVGR